MDYPPLSLSLPLLLSLHVGFKEENAPRVHTLPIAGMEEIVTK